MGDALKRRLRSQHLGTPVHEALLNLLVAAAHLRETIDRQFEQFGLTHAQYNVLRILRGGPPEGYARCEIAMRLIDRAPDVTRLVDRLEDDGLVKRSRCVDDRRRSLATITRKGLALLDRMEPVLRESDRTWGDRLSAADSRELSRLCEQLYGPDTP